MNPVSASRGMKYLMVAALGFAFMSEATAARPGDEVVVEVKRSKEASLRSSIGAPVEIISTTKRVTYADLDLVTHAGVTQLEARIQEAARSACATLERHVPFSYSPLERRMCVRRAVADGMAQARAIITAKTGTRTADLTYLK